MKRIIVILPLLALAGCASVVGLALSVPSRVEWQQVQSMGGMKLGTPIKTNGVWRVPIDCDATGSREITTKPDGITSFPVYYSSARVKQDGASILLYLKSRMHEEKIKTGRLVQITLPKSCVPGNYRVYYLNKDRSRHFIQSLSLFDPLTIVHGDSVLLPEYRRKQCKANNGLHNYFSKARF